MKSKHLILMGILVGWILILLISIKQKTQENVKIHPQNQVTQSQNSGGSLFEISKEKKTKSVQDLDILQKIYNKTKSNDILKEIIEKQAQNYQFNDAIANIQKLPNKDQDIDSKLYLYILINSSIIKLSDNDSISQFMQLIDQYTQANKITNPDHTFYLGLKEIWNLNYNQAIVVRQSIENSEYQSTINAFKTVITSHKDEKSLPNEYWDGLVALAALKNGYFNIARKVALEALNKNEKYILPYQILAYSHFLSNNRDVAIQYFLKLSEFDQQNKDMYNFLIGSAYYRNGDYSSSAIYLSQVNKTNQTDTLRYLLQDYIHLQTKDKSKEIWKKLLNQADISPSDYALYFYTIFYKSYFSMDTNTIEEYNDMSNIVIQNCKDRFPENDVCTYGEFGKATVENTIQANESGYIKLTQQYNLSYLYHIRGDYFSKNKDIAKAKESYARAIGLSTDSQEQEILKQKLANLKL